jgi:mono/diheme cytochrome c family protein
MRYILRFPAILLLLAGALTIAQSNAAQEQTPKPSELEQGKKLFNGQCAVCHGIEGTGSRGPALNGATNWWSPTYSPITNLFMSPFVNARRITTKAKSNSNRERFLPVAANVR